jgi:penicillin amidase
VVLIGRNQHISWSLTNTANQATFYYKERMDPAHPGQYFWNGDWRRLDHAGYDIAVKGAPARHLDVSLTVHGPILTSEGQTLAVTWMGNQPSHDLGVLLRLGRAAAFDQFRDALQDWRAPTQNFIYSDDAGHIGLVSAGYYGLVKSGDPWLPLPGTGEYDLVGSIPFAAIPWVYDPPSHYVFSANQRPVGPDYPYYIGTTLLDFDPGYRAARIQSVLSLPARLTLADMQRLQLDNHDYLAIRVRPKLLETLDQTKLTPQQTRARELLRRWDGDMAADQQAPTIWSAFWQAYLRATFEPWFSAHQVPIDLSRLESALVPDLEAWTLNEPRHPAFTAPGGAPASAGDVMAKAFARALEGLTAQFGQDPMAWNWGAAHTRTIASLLRVPALGWGPRPSSGDAWTVNAARGNSSPGGPSWRFIVDWGARRAVGIYPGGQSENPLSGWYADMLPVWAGGGYEPLLSSTEARSQPGSVAWTLRP